MQQTKGSWADVPHIKQAVRKVFQRFANRTAVSPYHYGSVLQPDDTLSSRFVLPVVPIPRKLWGLA